MCLRSSHRRCSVKKGVLRNFAKFTGKHLCQSLSFNKVAGGACNFIKKDTLAQVFSYEFCEVSKNTFFTEHVWAPASRAFSIRFWILWICLICLFPTFQKFKKFENKKCFPRIIIFCFSSVWFFTISQAIDDKIRNVPWF